MSMSRSLKSRMGKSANPNTGQVKASERKKRIRLANRIELRKEAAKLGLMPFQLLCQRAREASDIIKAESERRIVAATKEYERQKRMDGGYSPGIFMGRY
jgi:hypothetical protein